MRDVWVALVGLVAIKVLVVCRWPKDAEEELAVTFEFPADLCDQSKFGLHIMKLRAYHESESSSFSISTGTILRQRA